MNRHTIPLGRILGIPIGLDYSWFLIFGLITWTMAVGYYPAEFKDWPVAQYWFVGAATAIMLFVSVLLHELGHSVVAMHYKIPVRSITLFIFGGISQIGAEPPTAAAGFWIAIAGPAVSFALAALFSLLQPFLPVLPRYWPCPNIWPISTSRWACSTSSLAFPWTEAVSFGPLSGVSPTTCAGPLSSPPMWGDSSPTSSSSSVCGKYLPATSSTACGSPSSAGFWKVPPGGRFSNWCSTICWPAIRCHKQ